MSSTNRGISRDNDYYFTPKEEIKKFLTELKKEVPGVLQKRPIMDPCAGGDTTREMPYPTVLGEFGVKNVFTVDIREDSRAEYKTDYLDLNTAGQFEVIITNPPFKHALQIIQKALSDVKDGGYVIMLCRLNFLGSQKRYTFWQNNMPDWIFVHHKRMSFTEDGRTDSIEYAHFVWRKGSENKKSSIKIC